MDLLEIEYARSGDVALAYQVVSDGLVDFVFVPRQEIDPAGDGFFATFDGPPRAIRCAQAVVAGGAELGLDVRAALHTGE